ncbi:YrdB family protein [Nocardia callitridis]|uniref:DUF2568 domain-containing protein n=1 Tax=Nocardia callitridis TaxID=648753 RepID=A0ABP9K6J3_9NOCA
MHAIKIINLGVMFLLELGVLAGTAVWGATVPAELWVRLAAGIGAPALFVIMWAQFGAPNGARFPLTGGWRVGLELLWFGGGALAWGIGSTPVVGFVFFAVWVLNAIGRYLSHGDLIVHAGANDLVHDPDVPDVVDVLEPETPSPEDYLVIDGPEESTAHP